MAGSVYRRLLDVIPVVVLTGTMLCPLDSVGMLAGLPAVGLDVRSNQVDNKDRAAAEIERVIRAQIEAFARDDGTTAFSFAHPSIQRIFGAPERFMEMVISGYPMIHRPASLEFGPLDYQSAVSALQPIGISDRNGKLWVAIYAMTRLSDGLWRIAGVQVKPTGSNQI